MTENFHILSADLRGYDWLNERSISLGSPFLIKTRSLCRTKQFTNQAVTLYHFHRTPMAENKALGCGQLLYESTFILPKYVAASLVPIGRWWPLEA